MMKNLLLHEMRQTLRCFAGLAGSAMLLALLARLRLFSLTDMPLFYLILFGGSGIALYRFWRTMFGGEAVFFFSAPLSAGRQIICRLIAFAGLGAATTVLLGAAILLQGEEMAGLLLRLTGGQATALFVMISLSFVMVTTSFAFAFVLGNLPVFRRHRTPWCVVFAVAMLALNRAFPAVLATLPDHSLVIQAVRTAEPVARFSFSFKSFAWQFPETLLCAALMAPLTKKHMLLD